MFLEEILQVCEGFKEDKRNGEVIRENPKQVIMGAVYNNDRMYKIIKCFACAEDSELNGDGLFYALSESFKHRLNCNCSSRVLNEREATVVAKRVCKELIIEFLGFAEEYKGSETKCCLSCPKHGEWVNHNYSSLVHNKRGCNHCRFVDNEQRVEEFKNLSFYHPDTTFKYSHTYKRIKIWEVFCGRCHESYMSNAYRIKLGNKGCSCSVFNMKYCYVNIIKLENNSSFIKFGITNNLENRIKRFKINNRNVISVENFGVWKFKTMNLARKVEQEIKNTLERPVVSKNELPDGWTETTSLSNLERIIEIYEKDGGTRVI